MSSGQSGSAAPPPADAVTVTIDERTVQVPKGAGMVETALAAGVEIPVFCYEPRLGPPVGACRMCLVEVEGMPKLQAGCTLTAQDGMIVKTARTSKQAAEGQNATLEFILVNHPLDCPVCDKGGECPLGCNISATTREGKVKRVMSRNHPEVDEGWLCDKGRFAYAHLDASDRITAPVRKAGPRRFEALSWDDALDRAEELLRKG